MSTLKDMKLGPVKRICERELRDFCNQLEEEIDTFQNNDYISKTLVKSYIFSLMADRDIYPNRIV
jgi:hypothetical protein